MGDMELKEKQSELMLVVGTNFAIRCAQERGSVDQVLKLFWVLSGARFQPLTRGWVGVDSALVANFNRLREM